MQDVQRLRTVREELSKSQNEMACVLGIKQTQYSRYEIGKNEMPLRYYKMLARHFNLSMDYLTGLIDAPEKLDRG